MSIILAQSAVYDLKTTITNDRNFNITKEYDYITNPKESGYRGIHLISKFCGNKEEYLNLQIEIQLRSLIQHSWATAVEIIGTFTNQELKSGNGDKQWLEFFRIIGFLMTTLETDNLHNDKELMSEYKNKIKQLEKELKVIEKLATYSIVIEITEELEKNKGIFLIRLDISKRIINIQHFEKREISKAVNEYSILEAAYSENNIVLIEAKSIEDLKKGYPNYFADSNNFLNYLKLFLN